MFSFLSSSQYFLIFLVIFFFDPVVTEKFVFYSKYLGDFPDFVGEGVAFWFKSIVVRNHIWMIWIFFTQ